MKIAPLLFGVIVCVGSVAMAVDNPQPAPDTKGIGEHVAPLTA